MKILKKLLVFVMVVSSILAFTGITASAETTFDEVIETTVARINNEKLEGDKSFVMYLEKTDFMTAKDWNNKNYKWFDVGGQTGYEETDLEENNLCNFPLVINLNKYNFEEKILLDGVPLSELKSIYPYTLIGNKKTRIDTISIDFAEPVFENFLTIEILEGCQFPTLKSGYIGSETTSCIQITKSVKYVQINGSWIYHFEGYEEGKEYDGDEKMFYKSPEKTYKGHDAVPMVDYSETFKKYESLAGGVYRGLALASSGNTQKGYITVLRFINPINANEYGKINLRVYSNHKRTLYTYNDNNITESSLGETLEAFALDHGGVHTRITLTSSLYADENGMIDTIVFKFNEDGEPFVDENGNNKTDDDGNLIRDQLFFVSFNLSKETESSDILTKDSFFIIENENDYTAILRFNLSGETSEIELDKSKVILNGQTVAKTLSTCKTATASWIKVGPFYQISVTIPKSYEGANKIKNADAGYWGNSMGVAKGFALPNGKTTDKAYTCHVYITEKFLDCEVIDEYERIKVLDVGYKFVVGSDNLHIKIKFDKKVTSSNYNHVCETERWRETDLKASNPLYYDEGMSRVFVQNGFKSSLLDCLVINGKSVADWHAEDANAITNIQVHYGQSGLEYVDVHFESHSKTTYNQIASLARAGKGITVEIREGLKFMTNCSVQKTQVFTLSDGYFTEYIPDKNIHVYYDGSEVQNGESVTVETVVSTSSIVVEGVSNYEISHKTNGNVTEYIVKYGDNKEFKFSVTEDTIKSESTSSKKKGCKSSVEMPIVSMGLALIALAYVLKRRKVNE